MLRVSARSTARDVGLEWLMMVGMCALAAFCTSSWLVLDERTRTLADDIYFFIKVCPIALSRALWRPTSSAKPIGSRLSSRMSAACDPRVD